MGELVGSRSEQAGAPVGADEQKWFSSLPKPEGGPVMFADAGGTASDAGTGGLSAADRYRLAYESYEKCNSGVGSYFRSCANQRQVLEQAHATFRQASGAPSYTDLLGKTYPVDVANCRSARLRLNSEFRQLCEQNGLGGR